MLLSEQLLFIGQDRNDLEAGVQQLELDLGEKKSSSNNNKITQRHGDGHGTILL